MRPDWRAGGKHRDGGDKARSPFAKGGDAVPCRAAFRSMAECSVASSVIQGFSILVREKPEKVPERSVHKPAADEKVGREKAEREKQYTCQLDHREYVSAGPSLKLTDS